MRAPKHPPSVPSILSTTNGARLATILKATIRDAPLRDRYLHWDELLRRRPPKGLNHREWWLLQKIAREPLLRAVPPRDVQGRPFRYAATDNVTEHLHRIDLEIGGIVQMPEQVTTPETRDRYIVRGLVEEAITSSQLEGAPTTRPVAKEMIRSGRPPRDLGERMILNNYRTMQRIRELRERPLTPEMILDIHRAITAGTLEDDAQVGRLRTAADDPIRVEDQYGTVFHVPPPAAELPGRMEAMCAFANDETPAEFIHPILRSIMLHFWLAYDHPFVDGNGRVARALFYWSMLRRGYWLCEFISISPFLRKAPAAYGRAFLHSETDDNDLTYFIIHQLEVIRRAIDELYDFIRRETERFRALRARLAGLDALNYRQRSLVEHALRHPDARYTIEGHRVSHNVVYETARTDLLDLADRGLLVSTKVGRTYSFRPAPDLERRLKDLK